MPQTDDTPAARPALQIEQKERPQQWLQDVGCSRRILEIEQV